MPKETVAIAADHAGFALKTVLKEELARMGFDVLDLGTHDTERVDYPDFADALGREIESERVRRGVLICGSGLGISIAANRHRAVRAAPCRDVTAARLARAHNDANVLAFGERLIGVAVALECLHAFFDTTFEGGRHQRRVDKMS